jgi:hypothetical protein
LLEPDPRFRILVLFGKEPKTGKTWLIRHFRESLPPDVDHAAIDADPQFDNVGELMEEAVRELGENRLLHYVAETRRSKGPLKSVISDNQQIGFINKISVSLAFDPKEQRRRLTEAWLRDLKTLTRPLLISVDGYESASEEEKAWFRASLLPGVRDAPLLRVVIAGREAPEPHSSWASLCGRPHELRGVPEAKHWMPIVADLNRRIPVEPQEPYVQLASDLCHGNPDLIFKWIAALPERSAPR